MPSNFKMTLRIATARSWDWPDLLESFWEGTVLYAYNLLVF